jgi:hypothetical protein
LGLELENDNLLGGRLSLLGNIGLDSSNSDASVYRNVLRQNIGPCWSPGFFSTLASKDLSSADLNCLG